MIFYLNKKEREEINKLIETKYYNDEIADYINECVLNKTFQKEFLNNVDIKPLNINKYINDEYYRSIFVKTFKRDNCELNYDKYKPYQVFLYDDLSVDEEDYYLIYNHLGYFKEAYKFLALKKDNVTWMSIIPHEINTMQKLLNDKEEIYIFGLGLGYYPFFLKSKKITIIDNDKDIIRIFKENILPQFKNKESINIINDDAFSYLKNINKEAYIFIDLWHNHQDGLMLYYKLKKALQKQQHVFYWLEENIIASFRHLLIDLIEEELYHHNEYDYKTAREDNDIIINKLHHYFIDKKINSYREIKELLKSDNLKKLIVDI